MISTVTRLTSAIVVTLLLAAPAAAQQDEALGPEAAACRAEVETLRLWMRGSFAPIPPEEQLRVDTQIARTVAACEAALEPSGRDPQVLMDRAYAAIAGADSKRVAAYMSEAAEAGYPPAMVTWAQFLGRGQYAEKNAEEAWLLLLQTLKTDHVGARMQAAMEFLPGGVGPENAERAHKVFAELIEQGATEAMVTYAFRVLEITKASADDEDVRRGADLIGRAAELGDTEAMVSLALLHLQAYGVERDLEAARLWAGRALEAGNDRAYGTMAQISEAAGDVEAALEWYRRGAEAGDAFSQTMLGYLLSAGMVVDQDLDKAVEWWTRARWQGSRLAASYLKVHREQQAREAAQEQQRQAPKPAE